LDLPLLAIGTVLFLGIVMDGKITLGESIIMLVSYVTYLLYTVFYKDDYNEKVEKLPSRRDRRELAVVDKTEKVVKIKPKDIVLLIIGIVLLVFGAQYMIEALINLSAMLNIAAGVIAISAVAVGTSLPELVVSIKAAASKKSDVALGNIFGSNVFNALVVVGFPGLFRTLTVDIQTLMIGVPTMALATLLFVISGISKRIHVWEGVFYLALYVLFVVKLFAWF
jgi:cation:H+ antiporter